MTTNETLSIAKSSEILRLTISDKSIRVLDYGCGTGLSGAALLKMGFENLDGADPSKEMLSKAKEKNIYRSLVSLNLDLPNPISKGDYPIIIGSGLIGPGAAPIELFDTIISRSPSLSTSQDAAPLLTALFKISPRILIVLSIKLPSLWLI